MRFIIPIGLLLLLSLGYMDRVNFSVAAPEILKEFNLTTGTFGLLSSAFNWTYLVLLIPMGVVADRVGTKYAMPLFVVIWSIAAGITGLSMGVGVLLLSRLLMGVGESPINTAGQVVIREWAPARERGFFASMFNSGALIGPAVGSVLAAYLVTSFGWRASFFTLGVIGLLVGVIWYLVYSSPEKSKWLSARERDYIIANRETSAGIDREAVKPMGILSFLRIKTTWGLVITQGCMVYTNYLFLTFLPLYLVNVRHLKELGSGWVTGVTYGIAAVAAIIIGIIADRLVGHRQLAKTIKTRRWTLIVVVLMAIPLLFLPLISNTAVIIGFISWVLAFDFAGIALNWALASELVADKSSIGRLFALITVGGNILGLIAPIATGYLVDGTGSYTLPFIIAGLLLVVGAGATALLSRRPLQVGAAPVVD